MRSVHNSRLAIGAKTERSLTDTDEGYHIETSEYHITPPAHPIRVFH
jgi:hypothetical protein